MSAERAYLQCWYRQFQIIHRTCRRRKMKNKIQRLLNFDVPADVMIHEGETSVGGEAGDILLRSSRIVVHADNIVSLTEKRLTEMRANKPGATGYQVSSHFSVLSSSNQSRVFLVRRDHRCCVRQR